MIRENKYPVLKNADIQKYLSELQQLALDALITQIRMGRLHDGKGDQQYVVVAADWPMYEQVWGLIETYVDALPRLEEGEGAVTMTDRLKFSTDGGATWQEAETAMVDVPPKPDDQQTLRVNVTPWGAGVEVYDRTENEVQIASQFHPWDALLPKE